MSSRMDKYRDETELPKRSDKNKELYKQIYNAYDEFENLIVPSNAREIKPEELKREVISRQDYKRAKDYDIVNNNGTNNSVIRKEKILEEQKQEDDIYDINELLNKAKKENDKPELITPSLTNDDYLKKLKLDSRRTNIEQVKEMYDEMQEEAIEDESLMKTANLSLEILSDLKSDHDSTRVSAPIKDEELPEHIKDADFYSNTYEFSDKDFDGKDDLEEDEDDEEYEEESGGVFLRILIIVFGILLAVLAVIYFINYFGK